MQPGSYFGGDFTVAAWVYVPGRFSTWCSIIDFGNGPKDDNVVLALTEGVPFLASFAGSQKSEMFGHRPIALDTWVHLAGTVQGNSGALYCNGQQINQSRRMNSPAHVTRHKNYFGRSNWSSKTYANALLRDTEVVNVVETPVQRN